MLKGDELVRLLNFFESEWAQFTYKEQEILILAGLDKEITNDVVDFLLRKGKRLRPILFLSAWESFSGQRIDDCDEFRSVLRDVSLAIELVHAFVLVHDDVIDRSRTRRGFPTLHCLLNNRLESENDEHSSQSMAVVLGDILFARALGLMVDATSKNGNGSFLQSLFLNVVHDTGVGELCDIQMANGPILQFSLEDVEKMYHQKTTRYTIELPLVTAYLLAGGQVKHLYILVNYSKKIGLAFQITNDLKEFERSCVYEDVSEGDLIEKKKTWLLLKTRDLLEGADRAYFETCIQSHPRDGRFVYKIRQLMQKVDVAKHAERRVLELVSEAEDVVRNSVLQPYLSEKLVDLSTDLKCMMF